VSVEEIAVIIMVVALCVCFVIGLATLCYIVVKEYEK
jgi:uncharacterized protein YneF (UPF0154 family)